MPRFHYEVESTQRKPTWKWPFEVFNEACSGMLDSRASGRLKLDNESEN